jgi:shikimate kinase
VLASGSPDENLVLVGMPGAGKSTAGVLLAKRAGKDFLDTDLWLQRREGRSLAAILEAEGVEGFRRLEEAHVLALECRGTVIATGGSVVYGERAMARLRRGGRVIFLDVPLAELEPRLGCLDTRGVVRPPGVSVAELFAERRPLYLRWADVHVACAGLGQGEVADLVLQALR